jgi:hypothetical protein
MILTRIISGLGNQLFQWAVARSLAEKNQTEARLDISFYEQQSYSYSEDFPRPFKLKRFRIEAPIATKAQAAASPDFLRMRKHQRVWPKLQQKLRLRKFMTRIREPSFGFHPQVLEAGDNVYLDGYWASEKYFTSIAPIIRKEARVADPTIEDLADRFLAQHRQIGLPVVGVQVRKGDIHHLCAVLKRPDLAPTPLLPRDYFLRGMQHFGERCTFLMFSDSEKDLQLCRQEFQECKNITYVASNDDITDFVILQKCDHQIISNSTFGWWAAWLNPSPDKVIVAPQGWFAPNSPHLNTMSDLIPPKWLLR